jgi:hypothetical protein
MKKLIKYIDIVSHHEWLISGIGECKKKLVSVVVT